MPSFGERLRLEREKRKITLEQISASTKIGIRMLQALEADKFNQLPGGIFNKGFVRAYSRFVGLDEEQTVADYMQASGDAPPVSTEPGFPEDGARKDEARENEENVRRLESISDAPVRPLPWGLFAALLLAVALALSLWSHRRREQARESVRPTPTAATTQVPAAQLPGEVSGGVPVENSGARSPVVGSPSAGSPIVSSPATGSPTGESASSVAPKKRPILTPQELAAVAPAPAPGEFTVVIKAREESWISITADGTTVSSELLAAGEERAIRGRKEIIVKAGNAGGVDFQFNGKKLDIEGEFGEVKTVTFGPQGILPNAPALPSTP